MYKHDKLHDAWSDLIDIQWSFDYRFNRVFLTPNQVELYLSHISTLRRCKDITIEEVSLLKEIVKVGRLRYLEFQEKIRNEPRRQAQKFIGKKNIREFIFKRDGYRCLRCGVDSSLSLDHIISVKGGGVNRLSNLQTLCNRCNSWKSSRYIDFRKNISYGRK